MGQKVSTPRDAQSRNNIKNAFSSTKPRPSMSAPRDVYTTPRSIDITNPYATFALNPTTTSNVPPQPLAKTLRNRRVDRAAFTFFSCGRNIFIHFVKIALLDRQLIKAPVQVTALEESAEAVWIEVVMYDPQQRAFWEEAAKDAKAALTNSTVTSEQLLEAHGLPDRETEYKAWAASAVEELLARFDEERWPKEDESRYAHRVGEAGSGSMGHPGEEKTMKQTVRTSLNSEPVSAIDLRDLQPHLTTGVEPSIERFNSTPSLYSRDAETVTVRSLTPRAFTPESYLNYPYPRSGPIEEVGTAAAARLYLDMNMTPAGSSRHSIHSIAPSLCTNADTIAESEAEAEFVTMETVTPVKARIIDC